MPSPASTRDGRVDERCRSLVLDNPGFLTHARWMSAFEREWQSCRTRSHPVEVAA
jgi:hypothetical protein